MTLNPFSDMEHIHKKWLFQPHDKRAPVDSAQLTHEHACFLVNKPFLEQHKELQAIGAIPKHKDAGAPPFRATGSLVMPLCSF